MCYFSSETIQDRYAYYAGDALIMLDAGSINNLQKAAKRFSFNLMGR